MTFFSLNMWPWFGHFSTHCLTTEISIIYVFQTCDIRVPRFNQFENTAIKIVMKYSIKMFEIFLHTSMKHEGQWRTYVSKPKIIFAEMCCFFLSTFSCLLLTASLLPAVSISTRASSPWHNPVLKRHNTADCEGYELGRASGAYRSGEGERELRWPKLVTHLLR